MFANEERPDMISASATEMLRQDHERVKDLFDQFEKGRKDSAAQALRELRTHAQLEEKIFYPAVRDQLGEPDRVDEAVEEHHVVDLLIAELQRLRTDDERYTAKFRVLTESVRHHIQEEESDIFPRMERSGQDLVQLGADMARLKRDLGGSRRGGAARKSKVAGRTRRAARSGRSRAGARAAGSR